jgi:hypothetical protein
VEPSTVPVPLHTCRSPVFVLGHSRSGTSLTCRLFLDHLGVNFGTESQFIVRYRQRLGHYGDLTDRRRLRWLLEDISRERFFARTRQNFGFVFDIDRALESIAAPTYANAVRAIFEQFAHAQGRPRWGDKTPDYCHHLPVLRDLFPDAQFVHVVRDGRDVANSLFRTGFGPKNAYEAARSWTTLLKEIREFRDTCQPGAFLEIRYEDLTGHPSAVLATVGRFLGIANADAVAASIAPRLGIQVSSASVGTWKQRLTWREIECFEAFAGEALRAHGYPLQFRPRQAGHSGVEALYWRAQALCRRAANRRYWADNWYKLRLRLRDAATPLRGLARGRADGAWPRSVRP